MITKILIGIDDSTYAEHAVEYGFNLAEKYKAEVGLVHIVEPIPFPATPSTGGSEVFGVPSTDYDMEEVELFKIQDEVSEKLLAQVAGKYAGKAQITTFNDFGSTGEGIINCSKAYNADLIVLGTHHRSGLDRFLSGSVAEYVVRHSDIPVLVVPGKV